MDVCASKHFQPRRTPTHPNAKPKAPQPQRTPTHTDAIQATNNCLMSPKLCCVQICVVGGGAGGVEISLALNHRLKTERQKAGKHEEARCSVRLFSKGQILQGHTPAARHKLLRLAQVRCTTTLASWLFHCAQVLLAFSAMEWLTGFMSMVAALSSALGQQTGLLQRRSTTVSHQHLGCDCCFQVNRISLDMGVP